jgi:protein arginine kinase activator
MLCQKCKKRTATVHLTEIINNEKCEKHLCEQCAAQDGVTGGKVQEPINQLVAKFVLAQSETRELSQLACPECGMTFLQFRNGGLLGCPNDYDVFREPLAGLLGKAHEGRLQHVGKIPGGRENKHKRQHELMKLRHELQDAVDMEDYERAATLRDKIKGLEG